MTIASVTRTAYTNGTIADAIAANANEDAIVTGLNAAITGVNGVSGYAGKFVASAVTVSSSKSASSMGYTSIDVIDGGLFTIAAGATLTIDVPFSCGLMQCFSLADATAGVVFESGSVNEVYPEWWGVDGVDDTAAIQAALDTGEPVILTAVNYVVDGEIGLQLGSGAKLLSMAGSTITLKSTTNPVHNIIRIQSSVSDVEISGINFIGQRTGITGSENGFALHIRESDAVTVRGCTFTDWWTDGIYIGGSGAGAANVAIDSCVFDNNRRNGLSIVRLAGGNITNCRFINSNGTSPKAGVDVEPNSGGTCSDISFIGCEFADNAGPGLYLNSGAGGAGAVSNIKISNCTASGNALGGYSLSTVDSIAFASCTATGNIIAGWYIAKSSNVSVSGCVTNDNTGNGLTVEGGSYCTVSGGAYHDNTAGGIEFKNSSGTSGILASGHIVTGTSVSANTTNGIKLAGVNHTVSDNSVVLNGQHGVYLSGANNCSVSGNTVTANSQTTTGTYHGIYLVGSNYNNVQSNTVRKSTTWSIGKTAVSGTSDTIVIATSEPLVNGYFNGQTIAITGGTGSGQSKTVTSYIISGSGPYVSTITVDSAWSVTPDATSEYTISNTSVPLYSIAVSSATSTGNFVTNNEITEGGTFFDGGTNTATDPGNNQGGSAAGLDVLGYPIAGGVVFTQVASSYIRFANKSSIGTGDFTMLLDITPQVIGANQGIVVLSSANNNFANSSFYISLLSNNYLNVSMFKDASNLISKRIQYFATTYQNKVVNLCVRRTSGVVELFINGTETAGTEVSTGTATWADTITSTYSLVGMVYSLETFGGIVHNYSFVESALTDAEIAMLARGSYYGSNTSVLAILTAGTGTTFDNVATGGGSASDGTGVGTYTHMKPR